MTLTLLEPLSLGDLTEQEARWTLWYLGTTFEVDAPALRWSMKAVRPRYNSELALITIGPSCQAAQGPQRGTHTGPLKGARCGPHRGTLTNTGMSHDAPTGAEEEKARCP